MSNRAKLKRKRARLFEEQDGKCFYCGVQMQLLEGQRGGTLPLDAATFEHLDDRFSPHRGKLPGRRVVLACACCNHARGDQRVRQQHLSELHKRSGRWPSARATA